MKDLINTKQAIIFLDVDGVLNMYSPSYQTSRIHKHRKIKYLENHLVVRLNYIIEQTKAKFVVSSSWRDAESCLFLRDIMIEAGFKYWNRYIGKTPSFPAPTGRGDEIKAWLDEQPIKYENYIVLEDEWDDVCGERCNTISTDSVIKVDMKEGLTQKNVDESILKLKIGH